jgi:hypothetical protein
VFKCLFEATNSFSLLLVSFPFPPYPSWKKYFIIYLMTSRCVYNYWLYF